MKYIEVDKLKEVVDRVYNQYVYDYGLSAAGSNMRWIYDAIDSLQQEQPDVRVDLEKEIDRFWDSCIKHKNERGGNVIWSSKLEIEVLASHFYELGVNAKKEK